ncbi:MAG: transcriptional repressor LexA [Candidatus Omnitrophota bacterium]
MEELTLKQASILDFIRERKLRGGITPTLEEIRGHFRLKAIGTVQDHLRAIEAKGYIKRSRKSRSIEIAGLEARNIVDVPVIGRIAAGKPLLAAENLEDRICIDRAWVRTDGQVFALKVKGESMSGAGINDGDVAIIKKQPSAENGEIAAVMIDGEATLKRFRKEDGRITLKPENPAFKPLYIEKSRQVSILGKLIGIYRKY